MKRARRTKRGVVVIGAPSCLCFLVRLNHAAALGEGRAISDWAEQILEIFSGFLFIWLFFLYLFIVFQSPWFPFLKSLYTAPLLQSPQSLPSSVFENEVGHCRADDSWYLLSDRIEMKSVMEVKGNLSSSSLISRINAPEFL